MNVALKMVDVAQNLRRFDTADLSRHGKWIMPRMLQAFPHFNERAVATFLQNIVYNNEYLLLYQDDSVAMAQVISAHSLSARPIIQERFVWIEHPDDKEAQKRAANFYGEFLKWGKQQSAEAIILSELNDVPPELIKEKLGRVLQRQQLFARL